MRGSEAVCTTSMAELRTGSPIGLSAPSPNRESATSILVPSTNAALNNEKLLDSKSRFLSVSNPHPLRLPQVPPFHHTLHPVATSRPRPTSASPCITNSVSLPYRSSSSSWLPHSATFIPSIHPPPHHHVSRTGPVHR
jgi:hypothetical protein